MWTSVHDSICGKKECSSIRVVMLSCGATDDVMHVEFDTFDLCFKCVSARLGLFGLSGLACVPTVWHRGS